jgi:hypothetical protein
VTDDEQARRRRAHALREKIARLREGKRREPSSAREFVEREARRKSEERSEEDDVDPGTPRRD